MSLSIIAPGRLALAVTAVLCMSTAAYSSDLTVALFTSPLAEVQKKGVIEPFRQETGMDVLADNRGWGIGAVRAKIEGGGGVWDLVTVEDSEALLGCDEGFFAKIDKSKIPVLKDLDLVDKRFQCAIPFIFYGTVLGYNKNTIKEEPTSWADMWNLKKWPGRRGMNKTPIDALEIALLADGVPRDQVYDVLSKPEGVDRAFKKLNEIKPNIIWWQNPGQSRQMLVSGEVIMSVTYDNGIRFFNKTQGTNFGLVRKDAITHVNYWAIAATSKHVENAYKFLNYASSAKAQAAVTNGLAISTPNRNAMEYVDADLKPYLTANPEYLKVALPVNAEFWLNNYDAISQRFDTWLAE